MSADLVMCSTWLQLGVAIAPSPAADEEAYNRLLAHLGVDKAIAYWCWPVLIQVGR